MKKIWLAAIALTLVAGTSFTAMAVDFTGYHSDAYAAQTAHDAFNTSVKQRLSIARFATQPYGSGMAIAPLTSDSAYGQTPSSRYSSRRQLDCVYYNGFTVWGDIYGAWARQRSKDHADGYKYRVGGPALGFDWTNGTITAGIASTYSWGKIQGKDAPNERKTRTLGVIGYGQWNSQLFYANATVSYGYNRFSGNNRWTSLGGASFYNTSSSYNSSSWDFAGEFGYKMRLFNCLRVTPNVGLRFFHDDRDGFTESGSAATALRVSGRNYHVLELPIGVDVGYEIVTSAATLIPHASFTWTPELSRKRGKTSLVHLDTGTAFEERAARRGRNGFTIGGGLQAKFSDFITAHLDYNVELRDRKYEHRINAGLGFTF